MTTTTEASNSLERVGSIFDMLDEICDHMDGFSSAGETWLSSITETLALGAMSCTKQKAKATSAPRTICAVTHSLVGLLRSFGPAR